jgi:hypothetical protein
VAQDLHERGGTRRAVRGRHGITQSESAKGTDSPRIGGISFLHRFGSALNHHIHLRVCVIDGMLAGGTTSDTTGGHVRFILARPITPDKQGTTLARLTLINQNVPRHLPHRVGQAAGTDCRGVPTCVRGQRR